MHKGLEIQIPIKYKVIGDPPSSPRLFGGQQFIISNSRSSSFPYPTCGKISQEIFTIKLTISLRTLI